jgi:hypothetical protein
MKNLVFKSYNNGFVRAYFKNEKTLYCIQPGHHYLPELLVCSRDGEPSHPNEDRINYTFTNMPPDGDSWTWVDILAYFQSTDITSNGKLIRRMNELFKVTE